MFILPMYRPARCSLLKPFIFTQSLFFHSHRHLFSAGI